MWHIISLNIFESLSLWYKATLYPYPALYLYTIISSIYVHSTALTVWDRTRYMWGKVDSQQVRSVILAEHAGVMQTAMWACQPVDVESMLWLLFFNWLSRTWPRKLSYFIPFGDSQMAVPSFLVPPCSVFFSFSNSQYSSLFAICLSISYSFPYFTTTHPFQLCFLSPNLNYLFSIVLLLVSIPHTPLPSFSL